MKYIPEKEKINFESLLREKSGGVLEGKGLNEF
jgi:hypothetical protein